MLRLLVSVGLLSWLAWRTDWEQIVDAMSHLRLEFWLAAVGLLLLACVADIFCPIALPPWIGASIWATASCALLGLLALPTLTRFVEEWQCKNMAEGQGAARLYRRLGALILSISQALGLLFGRARLI